MADIVAWHGKNLQEHAGSRDDAAKKGYRFLSLSIYGSTSSPFYAAMMIKRPAVVPQRDFPTLTEGLRAVMIAATGSASNPPFAAVFNRRIRFRSPGTFLMNITKINSWSATGLFPAFNMSSL